MQQTRTRQEDNIMSDTNTNTNHTMKRVQSDASIAYTDNESPKYRSYHVRKSTISVSQVIVTVYFITRIDT